MPRLGTQKSSVHALPSSHTLAVPTQLPALHASPLVHRLLSLHAVVSATGVKTQLPVPLLHASLVHALLSLQGVKVPAHTPPPHLSLWVHDLPSSQGVPLFKLVKTQLPLLVLQLSVVHALPSSQTLAVPAQAPVLQASPVVQALPSSQPVPSLRLVYTHTPLLVLQLSPVQALPSLHTLAVPPHVPLLHLSVSVQGLPSLQLLPSLRLG